MLPGRRQPGKAGKSAHGYGRAARLQQTEPMKMDKTNLVEVEPVRFENGEPMLIAGLGQRYNGETSKAIPARWQRFAPDIGHIAHQIGEVTYGVMHNGDAKGSFDYVCGVQVSEFAGLPKDFIQLRLAAQRYAVFAHRDHISTIQRTVASIWKKWLPESKYKAADAPSFERYGPEFDPRTGNGGLEVWIPLKS
jgi:AraC family transcriptional regulator